MYLVVYGLRNAGLTYYVALALHYLVAQGTLVGVVGAGFIAAGLSSIMNNLPAVLVGSLAIHQMPGSVDPLMRDVLIFANIIGCDLGPKFTPIGSLATLLWLHVLGRKGISVSWIQYMRSGLLITPAVLLASLLALALWLSLLPLA